MRNLKPRNFRHSRIRKSLSGNSHRPRLALFCSHRNISAQLIDDAKQNTIFSLNTQNKDIRGKLKFCGNIKAANLLGEVFAKKAIERGITEVSYDRAGYLYHGKVKAFAEAARKAGLKF